MSCCRIARRNIRQKIGGVFLFVILFVVVGVDALFVARSVDHIRMPEYMDDCANALRSFLLNAIKLSTFDTH